MSLDFIKLLLYLTLESAKFFNYFRMPSFLFSYKAFILFSIKI